MDAKWVILLVVFAFIVATYVQGMRADANAGWREVLWPWGRRTKIGGVKPATDQGRSTAAE
jgi:hypothetical protein